MTQVDPNRVSPHAAGDAAGDGVAGREQMNIVIVGHVDHGKSTIVGRLLADTGSLPEGKLEAVRDQCRRNAKPFEYAFLLDALKDEQAQGITIDAARCFFQSDKREYILIDAPGHVEFLKNMISGAARAEAGLLVIDAKEGVRENSRRHGYLMRMLGVGQLAVCVNKMDLVDYDQEVFESIRAEYTAFLRDVGIEPLGFLPVSGREGDNIQAASPNTPWYTGPSVLATLDGFAKAPARTDLPLRMPVQDIYKFTAADDDRRIVAGRLETGSLAVGDEVLFVPSGKRSRVASIEGFHEEPGKRVQAGRSTGVTLTEQIYVRPGEVLCRTDQRPARSTTRLRVNLFWISPQPMIKGKRYQLKLGGMRTAAWLTEITTVLDASDMSASGDRDQIERHDVAECVLETLRPIACDPAGEIAAMGRLVVIDHYDVAGGGVVLDAEDATDTLVRTHVARRERAWDRTPITPGMRAGRYNQKSALVVLAGAAGQGKRDLAKELEQYLFVRGRLVYYLGVSNALAGIDADLAATGEREEYLRRLGEIAHLFTDAGLILITTVSELDDDELRVIQALNEPNEMVVVTVGECRVSEGVDLALPEGHDPTESLSKIYRLLQSLNYLVEYQL